VAYLAAEAESWRAKAARVDPAAAIATGEQLLAASSPSATATNTAITAATSSTSRVPPSASAPAGGVLGATFSDSLRAFLSEMGPDGATPSLIATPPNGTPAKGAGATAVSDRATAAATAAAAAELASVTADAAALHNRFMSRLSPQGKGESSSSGGSGSAGGVGSVGSRIGGPPGLPSPPPGMGAGHDSRRPARPPPAPSSGLVGAAVPGDGMVRDEDLAAQLEQATALLLELKLAPGGGGGRVVVAGSV